jgi:hypothetical protein
MFTANIVQISHLYHMLGFEIKFQFGHGITTAPSLPTTAAASVAVVSL